MLATLAGAAYGLLKSTSHGLIAECQEQDISGLPKWALAGLPVQQARIHLPER